VPPRPVVREPPAPARAAVPDPGPATAAATAPTTRVPALAELPATLRQQLPPLAFGGATDSTQPSARMLIVNGQIFREGDELAPGLRLERIRLRSAQMRWRDQPFEVAY
jgi:general secretion pathway protein B